LGADWVIVGTPTAHGVRVIASKNLKPGGEITIVQREDVVQAGPLSAPTLRHDHYRIVALAKDIVIVDGRDYAEALRMLMATWQPPERAAEPVAEIFAGPRTQQWVESVRCPSCRSGDRAVRLYSVIADGGRGGDCEDAWHG
jgi:hypothetical protein